MLNHKLLLENESSRPWIDFIYTGFFSLKKSSLLNPGELSSFMFLHVRIAKINIVIDTYLSFKK